MCIYYKYKYAHVGHLIVRGEFKGFVVLGVRPPLNKVCFLSSRWPKLWPLGRPQILFFFPPLFGRENTESPPGAYITTQALHQKQSYFKGGLRMILPAPSCIRQGGYAKLM